MLELTTLRKNKINLADYPFQQDIDSRCILSDFSVFDLEVLEEILFSPLKVSIKKLSRSLDCSEADLVPIFRKLANCALLEIQEDSLIVDKERRKYFEFQINRFEDSFKPDMEFLQGLLKQVPIHILPTWYAIPRSSNNIFESLVEKYFLTPQIYQRYLMELNFPDPVLSGIVKDVLSAPDCRVSSSDIIAKYNLTRSDFDLAMLQLEFHLVCFVTYTREEDHWHEWVTSFHEWRQYLLFLKETEAPSIESQESIFRHRESDFAFCEDMSSILTLAKKKHLYFDVWEESSPLPAALAKQLSPHCSLPAETPEEVLFARGYLAKVVEKLLLIRLGELIDGRLCALDGADDWIALTLENRALHLYRHSLNRLLNTSLPPALCAERHLREAEKSIRRTLHGRWVFFDEFIRGALVHLNDDSIIMLKKCGKQWKYTLPQYGEEEKALIKAAIFEWLFECGVVATGAVDGRECFAVTTFGQFFFED